MRIGIRLHDTIRGTLAERLSYVKKQGFSCAHLALSKTVEGFAMSDAPVRLADPAFAEEIGGAFRENGLGCALLGCYLNLADPDEERRRQTQEIYYAHLRFAKAMGAELVGTETYANPSSPFAKDCAVSEEAFRLFLDGLRPVARRAEEEDVLLAVEPVWYHIISTPARAQRMLEEIRSDHLRIILDAVNLIGPHTAAKAEEIVEEAIRRLGDRVVLLHMKDYVLKDGKMDATACGTGSMNYDALLRFAGERNLPMTLENTVPENAESARLFLEKRSREMKAELERGK